MMKKELNGLEKLRLFNSFNIIKENESAEKIYQELMSNNWEVLYDDRDNVSHGENLLMLI